MSNIQSVVALGFFDGVHIAHQKIISRAVNYAKENNLSPLALTFDDSPLKLLSDKSVSYITTNLQKKEIINSLGADVHFLPLNEDLLNMSPEEFIKEILVEKFNIKYAVCGYNYRFGKNGSGDTNMLISLGKQFGFNVEVCDCVESGGESISSSRIRKLISDGNIKEANLLLGRNFYVSGTVCEGKHLGRTIGFPTANVFFNDDVIIPKNGVYKTIAVVGEKSFTAITNTGINPTVGGEKLRTETYIPSLYENLYGKEIRIEFVDFIRPEIKFESIEHLKNQISKDIKSI